ncbi:MAG: TetR family transcriptional regulator [Solirubrobacterales bacterium]|nr:TetR family transcriptional regulator [Solirubrobacterales bacterium]
MQIKRTQEQRSAATRAALLAAARPLFSQRGYADVGTPEIVAAAGVTRGALYHQFDGKLALFEAVFEQVEQEVTERIGRVLAGSGATDAIAALRAGAEAWLDACAEPEVQRIILLEAPAALGWERWRELGMRYGMGLVEAALAAAMAAGEIPDQPVRPLAHVLIGALDEAALYVARAPDPQQARTEVGAVLDTLLAGLVGPADSSSR